jgi:uncharacterized membrane protein YhdT
MRQRQQPVPMGNPVIVLFTILVIVGMKYGFASDPQWYTLAYISLPLLIFSLIVYRRKK